MTRLINNYAYQRIDGQAWGPKPYATTPGKDVMRGRKARDLNSIIRDDSFASAFGSQVDYEANQAYNGAQNRVAAIPHDGKTPDIYGEVDESHPETMLACQVARAHAYTQSVLAKADTDGNDMLADPMDVEEARMGEAVMSAYVSAYEGASGISITEGRQLSNHERLESIQSLKAAEAINKDLPKQIAADVRSFRKDGWSDFLEQIEVDRRRMSNDCKSHPATRARENAANVMSRREKQRQKSLGGNGRPDLAR